MWFSKLTFPLAVKQTMAPNLAIFSARQSPESGAKYSLDFQEVELGLGL